MCASSKKTAKAAEPSNIHSSTNEPPIAVKAFTNGQDTKRATQKEPAKNAANANAPNSTIFGIISTVAVGAVLCCGSIIFSEVVFLGDDNYDTTNQSSLYYLFFHLRRRNILSFEQVLCVCAVSIATSVCFIMSSLSKLKQIKMNMPFVYAPLPFFGSVNEFIKTVPWDLMTGWHGEHGTIYGFYLLGRTCIAVSSPKYLKIMLQTRSVQKDVAFSYKPFLPILGTGIVTSEGKHWMKQRVGITHSLTIDVLEEIPRITLGAVQYLCRTKLDRAVRTGESVEMAEELRHLTLQVISETFLSISAEESDHRFGKMYLPIVEEANKRVWHPERGYAFFMPFFWKHKRDCYNLNNYVSQLIRDRWELRKEEKQKNQQQTDNDDKTKATTRHPDVLDTLLSNLEKQRRVTNLTNEMIRQLRDEMKTFMLAGHETSAAMMTWVLYELCIEDNLMEMVSEEASSVFKENFDWCAENVNGRTLPSRDELSKLVLSEGCLKESLRKYSVIPTVSRMVVEDTQVGPHFVPKGTSLFISIQGVHHNPEIWPDPEKFDPLRFCDPNPLPAPYTFIPFIAGPRSCLGQALALLESKIVIGLLLQRYNFTLKSEISGNPKHPFMVPVIPKAGVDVYVSKRV